VAQKQISGWSLTASKRRSGEPVWRLTKPGRRIISMRFEEGMDEELMVRRAMNAIEIAEADERNEAAPAADQDESE
jgi:hypothetical protein